MSDEFTPRPITGDEVVAAARAWLGVPFKHAGTTREGVCCSGLVLAVGKGLAQVPEGVTLPAHSPVRPSPRLFLRMRDWGSVVPEGEGRPGDVVLMTHGGSRFVQHCAILSGLEFGLGLVHIFPAASIPRVSEHHMDDEWRRRVVLTLRYKGVAG
jgi:cell wall-associated NlpC family hydrolase